MTHKASRAEAPHLHLSGLPFKIVSDFFNFKSPVKKII